jgi:hypothetical protein|tara:strand:- start:153 stop:497 length:345 start_codon:yes stop_codon:yes gene_type:complete
MSIDIHISPSKVAVNGKGIDALISQSSMQTKNGKRDIFLGTTSLGIAMKLKELNVENASHSSCMEFATEYGWSNDDDALVLWDKAWDKYLTLLNSKDALEQFNEIQSTITSEVK